MTSPTPTSRPGKSLGAAFFLLLAAQIIFKLWVGMAVLGLRPTGDENAYIDAAMALSNLARDLTHFALPDISELRKNVIVNGWFMPGMPAMLSPLYMILPDANTTTLRIYLGCMSFAMWLWAVMSVDRHLGRAYAYALMIFPSLTPIWVAFSFTAWGDLYAGLLLVILFCHSFTAARKIYSEGELSLRDGARIGALAAATLYIRSSVFPLLLLLLAFLAFAWLTSAKCNSRVRALPSMTAALGVLIATLLPWSLSASLALGAPVVTTTTVPVSMAVAFGDRGDLCFGPCKRGNIWFNSVAYSKAIALESGASELSIQKEMSRHAMRGVTPASYSADVLGNFGRYAFNPGSFAGLFATADPLLGAHRDDTPKTRKTWLRTGTTIPYFAFMALLVVAWLTVATRSLNVQIISILVKLFSVALLAQPFVHVGGGRYWTTFGPIFALAAGMLWSLLHRDHFDDDTPPSILLTVAQWVFIVGAISASTVLIILGAQGGYFRP